MTLRNCCLHELCCDQFTINYLNAVKKMIIQKETDYLEAIPFFMCI